MYSVQLPVNCTVSITLYTPAVVGVPEITPLYASAVDKPGGNPVALYVLRITSDRDRIRERDAHDDQSRRRC